MKKNYATLRSTIITLNNPTVVPTGVLLVTGKHPASISAHTSTAIARPTIVLSANPAEYTGQRA